MSFVLGVIEKIIRVAWSEYRLQRSDYGRSLKFRSAANDAIAELSLSFDQEAEGEILCEALWDHPLHWIRVAIIRNAIVERYGSGLIGVYLEDTRQESIETLRALPLSGEECISNQVKQRYLELAGRMLRNVETPRDLCEIEMPRGYPASYFYDGVLKQEKIGRVDIGNPRLNEYLARTLQYLDDYQAIVDGHNIKSAIISHPTHFRFSTLVWVLILNNIPIYLANAWNGHISIRVISTQQHMTIPYDDAPTAEEIQTLTANDRRRLISVGRRYLARLHEGNEGEVARVGVYGSGKAVCSDRDGFIEKVGADPMKPIVVVMGNCWPDYPSGYGPTWYTDYVDWFLITCEIIKDLDSCNWLLKVHPAESEYGTKTTLRKLVGDHLPTGMFHWPEGVSGVEINAFADCVVTARGTSAIEYSAAGKKVITASPSIYSSCGFVHVAGSRPEYHDLLRKAHILPGPNKKQIEDAQIFIASTSADENSINRLRFPYQWLSYRLYSKLPAFLKANATLIAQEVEMVKVWDKFGAGRYNTFKNLEHDKIANRRVY